MDEDRDLDKKIGICAPDSSLQKVPSRDHVKSLYIASGMSIKEIAETVFVTEDVIKTLVEKHNLVELRKAYIREGINKIQNKQVSQAQQLMDLELNFKKMRIIQLENQLKDFMAYYARHGDFCKRHPVTGDILKNNNGIAMQIQIPNVSREVSQLKESVTLSEGMKHLLTQIDDILNSKRTTEIPDEEGSIIDISTYDAVFKSSDD